LRGVPLPGEEQIEQDVKSYRHVIEIEMRDPLKGASAVGTRLYRALIAPVRDMIPKDGKVVIVPDGALHSLNFETLPVDQPAPHYWIDDVTISVAPSLGILSEGSNRVASSRSLLIFGSPQFQGTGYAPLPQASVEIERVRRHFPAQQVSVFTGDKASPSAYFQAQPKNFGYIHFATHSEANRDSPLDSAIVLSPSQAGFRLFARNVAELPINADLVTLSACRGSGTRNLAGEGLVGFAWAFFQAGAKNVVASLWDVSDTSTADLMDSFYAGLEKLSFAESLRQAKLTLIRSGRAKPYYWAPFQLYSRVIRANVTPAKSKAKLAALHPVEQHLTLPGSVVANAVDK
jgi:CHAT domain-containing protein